MRAQRPRGVRGDSGESGDGGEEISECVDVEGHVGGNDDEEAGWLW